MKLIETAKDLQLYIRRRAFSD